MVLFVEKVEQVNQLVEVGISVRKFQGGAASELAGHQSNPCPICPSSSWTSFCVGSCPDKIVYNLRKVMSVCKSPLLKHVVSNRLQLYIILINRDEDLYVCFRVWVEDFDYVCLVGTHEVFRLW